MMIFRDHAPAYWAKGLPVIPLQMMQKKPAIARWSEYCNRMPDTEEQTAWLEEFKTGNLGIALGKQSDLFMLDIDTDEPRILAAIENVLAAFPSPWKRIGKKGCVYAYRQPIGGIILRKFSIKNGATRSTIIDGLSDGAQVVLPPSIHPETKLAYQANCDLLDVIDKLPRIPSDIETLLRAALEAEGINLSQQGLGTVTEFISVGARDSKMVGIAGLYASEVCRGQKTLMEAIAAVTTWIEDFTEKVAGDDISPQKGVERLINFLIRDVVENKKVLPQGWDEGITDEMKQQLGLSFEKEHVEWSYDEIVSFLQEKADTHGPHSEAWTNTVEYILERVARSATLGSLAVENVLRTIGDLSANRLNISILRKRLKEMKQGDIEGSNHSEIAKKALEELSQYGEIRFHSSNFYQWAGSHWSLLDRGELIRKIMNDFGNLAVSKRHSDYTQVVKAMADLCARDLKQIDIKGVNFANGFLTEDLILIAHDRDYGCTYTLPYQYKPTDDHEAACPMFMNMLHRYWSKSIDGDFEQKKMALQEAMAATLFGRGPRFQRCVLLFGLAGTGKSELLKIIESLLPDEVISSVSPEMWGDKFAPATMVGKLLNIAGELSNSRRIEGPKFKSIITGDRMQVQFKNQPIFDFHPECMHWFASNHPPKTEDTSDGFNRRWLILRFDHPIKTEERDPSLARRIVEKEREAIVAWAVQAISRLHQRNDYTLPKSHQKWLEEVANNNNSVRFFMSEDRLAPKEGKTLARISETRAYEVYSNFCMMQGIAKHASLRSFKMAMVELAPEYDFTIVSGTKPDGSNEVYYENLILAGAPETYKST